MAPKTATIRQTRTFPAKPEDVYEALVDAKKHAAFTGSGATSDPRTGGRFTAWDGYIFGKYVTLEKGKRIVQEWQTTEWPSGSPPSVIEFGIERVEGGTRLTMVQSGVPAEQAEEYRQGWIDNYWKPMKEYFGRRRAAKPRP
jgi:activator of HSP90 ATPase